MKKNLLLALAIAATGAAQAQWTADPAANTLIDGGGQSYNDARVSTSAAYGITYVQWKDMDAEYRPYMRLQSLDALGAPRWSAPVAVNDAANQVQWDGASMAATADGGALVLYADSRTGQAQPYAGKIGPDGQFQWGAQGVQVFEIGNYFCALTQITPTPDGGAWLLVMDADDIFLRRVEADGQMGAVIQIDDEKKLMFPRLATSPDGGAFVVYQRCEPSTGMFELKEMLVAKYSADGALLHGPATLMEQTDMPNNFEVSAVADQRGGGYAWIWHFDPNFLKTYVFHFDAQCAPTITGGAGTIAGPEGETLNHLDADGAVDPATNDLVLVYRTEDSDSQLHGLRAARVTAEGAKVWGDAGIELAPQGGQPVGNLRAAALPLGQGLAATYTLGQPYMDASVEAKAIGFDGAELWHTTMASNPSPKVMCLAPTGFHNGQSIVAWRDTRAEGDALYGQNINADGTLGTGEPQPCQAPTGLGGQAEANPGGHGLATLRWEAAASGIVSFKIYRSYRDGDYKVVGVADGNARRYTDTLAQTGTYYYQVTTQYACCESPAATTPDGQDHVAICVVGTGAAPRADIDITHDNSTVTARGAGVAAIAVHNLAGQPVASAKADAAGQAAADIARCPAGIYFATATTADGRAVTAKIVKR